MGNNYLSVIDVFGVTRIEDVLVTIELYPEKNIDNIHYKYTTEPIEKFYSNIISVLDNIDYFPETKTRINSVYEKINRGEDKYPIIYDVDSGILIEGRHRLVAFKLLDLKEIPVLYLITE